MPTRFARRARSRRGYGSMIGLLLVMAIIGILMYKGYFEKDPKTGKSQSDFAKGRAKETACISNRNALKTDLSASASQNATGLPSINILRARYGQKYTCPGVGKLQIDKFGGLYCTEHEPAPDGVVVQDLN